MPAFSRFTREYHTCLYGPIHRFSEGFWKTQAERIKTLLYNRIPFEEKGYETEEDLLDFVNKSIPSYSPEEKLANLLEHFFKLTEYDGQEHEINVQKDIVGTEIWGKFYFRNPSEFVFYLENLESRGLISYAGTFDSYLNLKITLAGLTELMTIRENRDSRYCFVAMSFDKTLRHIFDDGILPALTETGFLSFIVSDTQFDAERTINDEIIAGLKKARFTIADFTQQKLGVYFEAGYALGRGQKVIYTCSRSDFDKSHFDVNHFQHIIWESTEDLKKQLVDKISAYVLE
jgi:hypothetical protein